MPIDFFFRSMAEELQERAICIVLSGTGADGTLGLRAVKGEGGTAFVQQPSAAQYDGMPQSAIATGVVDFVLPAEEMPKALLSYVKHSQTWSTGDQPPAPKAKPDDLQSILALLRARTNHDFRCYKKGTLTRRIQRRMGLRQTDGYGAYLKLLREDPTEVKALLRDLLIGVTSFFRDPEAWKDLEGLALVKILAKKGMNDHLRVWVPGCSSGEEAYSLAMLIMEAQGRLGTSCTVQIFASDIDEEALEIARNGVYPESIAADVPPERLRRFFDYEDGRYRVSKPIRESVVFANQNLVRDPPFSKLDLISCRNLLIYLDAPVQQRIISLLHFSLNEGGYLLLGPSESVAQQDDLFETVSKKWRIFRRIGVPQRYPAEFPLVPGDESRRSHLARSLPREPRPGSITALAHEVLLQEYAPPSVIVNRRGEALYYHGKVSRYLELASGEPTRDISELARDGLRIKVRTALQRSIRENEQIQLIGRIRGETDGPAVNITVRPLEETSSAEGLLLITFEDVKEPEPIPLQVPSEQTPEEIKQLEYELTATREDLQSTIEELETSNEEFKASNEEVMSMNEELQSTNEELETSKEELQSLNEELRTVNNQLQDKILDLEAANNDMANLLNSTSVATLFLDRKLHVRRFTPAATRLFRLIPADVGRHLEDIALRFQNGELLTQAQHVLESLHPIEKTVVTQDGSCFLCRILPYRTLDDHIDGVVLTSVDITELRASEDALRRSEERLQLALEAVSDGLWDWDLTTGAVFRSPRYYELVDRNPDEDTRDFDFFMSTVHPDDLPQMLGSFEAHKQGKTAAIDFCYRLATRSGETRWMSVRGSAVKRDPGGAPLRIVGTLSDITERKKAELQLIKLSQAVEQSPTCIMITDLDARLEYVNQALIEITGYSRAELIGQNPRIFQSGKTPPETYASLWDALTQGRSWKGELYDKRKDGSVCIESATFSPIRQPDGTITHYLAVLQDITEMKEAQLALQNKQRELEEQANRLADMDRRKDEFLALLGHELRNPLMPIRNAVHVLARQRDSLPEQVTWAVDLIGRQSEQLRRLVDDLLEVSRVSHGRIKLQMRPVPLQDILSDALETTAPMMEEFGHRLHLEQPKEPLTVYADPVRMAQVFTNLLVNAAKFTPARGEIRVEVRCEGDEARVTVQDNGIGIRHEELSRLFDPFSQGHSEDGSVPAQGGLGMGLALAKMLVESHGGRIEVHSDGIGHGSEFSMHLPLHEAEVSMPKGGIAVRPALTNCRRILVIDDNPDVARSMTALLQVMGHEVKFALDPEEGLKTVLAWRPDVVFIDISMPGMDGYQLAGTIRTACQGDCPLLVAVTGFGHEQHRVRALAAGFDHHLLKPPAPEDIEAILEEKGEPPAQSS